MFDLFIVFLMIVAIVGLVISKCLYIIPPRHFAIVEYLGKYHTTLYPGLNFIVWPVMYLKHLNWSWENKTVRGFMYFYENCQMDIRPIECTTKDQVTVILDGTIFYNITRPEKAVYEVDDVLNTFYQNVIQAIRNSVATFSYDQMNGYDNLLNGKIRDCVNDSVEKKYGIRCGEFVVQSTKAKNQTIIDIKEKRGIGIADLEQTKIEAEKIKILNEARGFTKPEHLIEMERAKNVRYHVIYNCIPNSISGTSSPPFEAHHKE